jgi:very-short-patch-repair endonuclease
MINADTIKYLFQNKHHHYFPDFYIPSLNLIIEIKSKWTIKQQGIEKINAKEKATITNGFKYLVIVEKNYNEFNKLIHY